MRAPRSAAWSRTMVRMRKVLACIAAIGVSSFAVWAQTNGQRTAVMVVSVHVVPSCRIDVQYPGRVHLRCATAVVGAARVRVNGQAAEPLSTLVADRTERVFVLPSIDAVVASAARMIPAQAPPAEPLVVTIDF